MNPFATQDLRAQSLASIEYVDFVFINNDYKATELLKSIKPDIYIKGQEYAKDKKVHPGFVEERELIESLGGKIVYTPGDLIFSSSQIINDLLKREDIREEKIHNFLARYSINKKNLSEIIEKYKDIKVLIIGDFLVEEYFFCNKPKVSTNSSILNFDFLEKKKFFGGAGLIAQQIQSLGGDVKLLGVGNEEMFKIFEEKNKNLKEKIDFIKLENFFPSVKTTFLCNEQKIMELNNKNRIKLDEKTEMDLINKIISILNEFQAVIFCDYGGGLINRNIINSITEETRKRGILCTCVIDDEGFWDLLNYKFLDFIVCSEKEARYAVNNFSDGIDFLSKDFLSKTRYNYLIMNLGREGLICYNPAPDPQQISSTYTSYLPFFSNQITDGTGVKEVLISTILLSLASHSSMQTALYLGGCVSAIEFSKVGNEPVYKEELLSFLESRNGVLN
jgi:rfaE bifunctional protein kinase chain/domain